MIPHFIARMAVGLVLVAPPQSTTPADPALKNWFESLKQPETGKPCCSISDCRMTAYEIKNNHYEVMIEGWRYIIPESRVLHVENPTGEAVVCRQYTTFHSPLPQGQTPTGPQDEIEVLCFIPPRPFM